MRSEILKCAALGAAIAAFSIGPAGAKRMDLYNARHGCEQLVTQAHPDLKGKDRHAEIRKCKADSDVYGKSTGI